MSGTTLDPESELIKRETVGILIEAVFRLSDENAYIFRLFIEGFDEKMIAELFETTEMAVRGRLNRTRKFITEYVEHKNGDGGGPVFKKDGVGAV